MSEQELLEKIDILLSKAEHVTMSLLHKNQDMERQLAKAYQDGKQDANK